MRMSARLSNAEERMPREPLATPTTSLVAARVTALPTEKRAVPIRFRSLSPFESPFAMEVPVSSRKDPKFPISPPTRAGPRPLAPPALRRRRLRGDPLLQDRVRRLGHLPAQGTRGPPLRLGPHPDPCHPLLAREDLPGDPESADRQRPHRGVHPPDRLHRGGRDGPFREDQPDPRGGSRLGTGKPGPITKKIQNAFFDIVRGNDALFAHWLDVLK